MRQDGFLEPIRDRGGLGSDGAIRDAAEATVQALGERIAAGEGVVTTQLSSEYATPYGVEDVEVKP